MLDSVFCIAVYSQGFPPLHSAVFFIMLHWTWCCILWPCISKNAVFFKMLYFEQCVKMHESVTLSYDMLLCFTVYCTLHEVEFSHCCISRDAIICTMTYFVWYCILLDTVFCTKLFVWIPYIVTVYFIMLYTICLLILRHTTFDLSWPRCRQ